MIPLIEAALSELPTLLDADITALVNGDRKVFGVATASFEVPSADALLQDKVIEVYGEQTVGDIRYIYFTPKVKKSNGVLQRGEGVWSLNADYFLQYVSH